MNKRTTLNSRTQADGKNTPRARQPSKVTPLEKELAQLDGADSQGSSIPEAPRAESRASSDSPSESAPISGLHIPKTPARLKPSPRTQQTLVNQAISETVRWENILADLEAKLDKAVFTRFNLRRVKEQAGKHAPIGLGRVYVKSVGFKLPKVIKDKTAKPKEVSPVKLNSSKEKEKEVAVENAEEERTEEAESTTEAQTDEPSEPSVDEGPECVLCGATDISAYTNPGEFSKIMKLKNCEHSFCVTCLTLIWLHEHDQIPPGCCEFDRSWDILFKWEGLQALQRLAIGGILI